MTHPTEIPPSVLEIAGVLLEVGQKCAIALLMESSLMKLVDQELVDASGAALITEFFRGAKIIVAAVEAGNQSGAHKRATARGEVA